MKRAVAKKSATKGAVAKKSPPPKKKAVKPKKPAGVAPIPEGQRTVTPHLVLADAASAIEFYKKAFGAKEIMRMPGADGRGVMHAEMMFGDSFVYLADEYPGTHVGAPQRFGGTTVSIHLYVKDADATFTQAVAAGAKVSMPMMDMFWGDRFGKVTDPFGHEWSIATHVEDVPEEEMGQRMEEAMKNMQPGPPPG